MCVCDHTVARCHHSNPDDKAELVEMPMGGRFARSLFKYMYTFRQGENIWCGFKVENRWEYGSIVYRLVRASAPPRATVREGGGKRRTRTDNRLVVRWMLKLACTGSRGDSSLRMNTLVAVAPVSFSLSLSLCLCVYINMLFCGALPVTEIKWRVKRNRIPTCRFAAFVKITTIVVLQISARYVHTTGIRETRRIPHDTLCILSICFNVCMVGWLYGWAMGKNATETNRENAKRESLSLYRK